MTKYKLTDGELVEWGLELSEGQPVKALFEELKDGNIDTLYEWMLDTAGPEYRSGEANWDFNMSDAERMIKLIERVWDRKCCKGCRHDYICKHVFAGMCTRHEIPESIRDALKKNPLEENDCNFYIQIL